MNFSLKPSKKLKRKLKNYKFSFQAFYEDENFLISIYFPVSNFLFFLYAKFNTTKITDGDIRVSLCWNFYG